MSVSLGIQEDIYQTFPVVCVDSSLTQGEVTLYLDNCSALSPPGQTTGVESWFILMILLEGTRWPQITSQRYSIFLLTRVNDKFPCLGKANLSGVLHTKHLLGLGSRLTEAPFTLTSVSILPP